MQALKKILVSNATTPTLSEVQVDLIMQTIDLYESDTDQINQINPYMLLALFDEVHAPIPPTLWERRNTLEKAYIDHIRQEKVVAKQATIKTSLLDEFTTNSMRDMLAKKYILVAYDEDKIPASVKSICIRELLPYFRHCANGRSSDYDDTSVDDYIQQSIAKDILKELTRA